MAFNPDQYYPQYPGGPYLATADHPSLPRIPRTNFDTTKTIEDKVRGKQIFAGLNDQQMQGYIQNEINKAHTDAVGLPTHYGNDPVNRAADVFDGHSA